MKARQDRGPAEHAARRHRGPAARARAYPLPAGDDPTGTDIALAATRALLAATTREEAAAVLRTAVHDLGAGTAPARLADLNPEALAVDVSLGVGEPRVVVVDGVSPAGLRVALHLPALLHDATLVAARCDLERSSAGNPA